MKISQNNSRIILDNKPSNQSVIIRIPNITVYLLLATAILESRQQQVSTSCSLSCSYVKLTMRMKCRRFFRKTTCVSSSRVCIPIRPYPAARTTNGLFKSESPNTPENTCEHIVEVKLSNCIDEDTVTPYKISESHPSTSSISSDDDLPWI